MILVSDLLINLLSHSMNMSIVGVHAGLFLRSDLAREGFTFREAIFGKAGQRLIG